MCVLCSKRKNPVFEAFFWFSKLGSLEILSSSLHCDKNRRNFFFTSETLILEVLPF